MAAKRRDAKRRTTPSTWFAIGARAARVRDLFKESTEPAPEIVFIHTLDATGTDLANLVSEAALSPGDRRRTAYRVSGHTLVGMLTLGADPVRKISLVPHGQPLGGTFSAPAADRCNYEQDELEAKIRVALGGRCAEELVFGQPSTDAVPEPSQRWLILVDDEVPRIVEESHAAVLGLLRANRWRLDGLAAALLRYGTLDQSTAYAAAGLPEPGSAPGSLAAAAFGATRAAA